MQDFALRLLVFKKAFPLIRHIFNTLAAGM